ncbi:MAG: SDR family NAD(P)-dependent oxidoreductase [Deltaproteobacteria bacterium]|jgi:NAD(P)-dependent dehydrogenase (short-subunit alcohol dehydrogenase family)
MNLKDKIAVITGAGSGIGRATALRLAREGVHVHVVDIDPERAEQVATEVRATGRNAWAHAVDCSKHEAIMALADAVYAESGRVDILHNNAGIGHAALAHETRIEDWERVIGINLWGTIYGIHTFVPRMIAQGSGGHIVNTSSGLGLIAVPGMAPYCATKFAVVGISESIRAELEPHGIGVTVVCPGLIQTDIVRASPVTGAAEAQREKTMELYAKHGATAESVAADIVTGIQKNKAVVTSPASHVMPVWALKRLSVDAYQTVAKHVGKRVLGVDATDALQQPS